MKMKLGRFLGIDVYLHFTLILFLLWVLVQNDPNSSSFLLTLLVFTVIVLHEYGHALTARYFGIATRDITLYPIGGIASLEYMPRNPRQEFLIALAGPAVNIVLAALFYFLFPQGMIRFWMVWINMILAAFNLLPLFPSDGGRILRAFMAFFMPHNKATIIASFVGQFLAILLGGLAIWQEMYMLSLVALFIWFAAGRERQAQNPVKGFRFKIFRGF